MKIKLPALLVALILLGLLVETAIQLHSVKGPIQLIMLGYGALTLIALILKRQKISTILFSILLGLILYINFYELTEWIIEIVDPNKGTVLVGGERKHIMDMTFIWAIFFGLMLTPPTIVLYHKLKQRNRVIEIIIISLFILINAFIYFEKG